ncbi:MAG: phage tail protein [Parasphingorhabdus sp.]|nr:phage tail protein [Parasphingorhabdus sp.]
MLSRAATPRGHIGCSYSAVAAPPHDPRQQWICPCPCWPGTSSSAARPFSMASAGQFPLGIGKLSCWHILIDKEDKKLATIILTAVGTALGGPIGGAIGAIAGQAIDQNLLFKPNGREGPRLKDISVQTSNYGAQIPKIFGTLRVAGSVIWATDLKEIQNREGGGKGRPKTTTYSYSANFAVALSSREILNIGRIWADGNLLRGSGGDFKSQTSFRFYSGAEDQVVDSFIAASEGANGAPAHRGIALAVFEDFDLTDYGNRIPSLTFEVVADDGSVTLVDVASELSKGRVDGTLVDSVSGFAAAGDDARSILQNLATVYSLSFIAQDNGDLTIAARHNVGDVTPIEDLAATTNGKPLAVPENSTVAETQLPVSVALRYYDPSRDYQSGMQTAFRTGKGLQKNTLDHPAALAAAEAKDIANRALWTPLMERSQTSAHILNNNDQLRVGAAVGWPKSSSSYSIGIVRSWEWKGGSIAITTTSTVPALPAVSVSTDSGRSIPSPDRLTGRTRLAIVDLPYAIDAPSTPSETPEIYVAAAGTGTGWRQAELLLRPEGSESALPIGQTALPAIMGHCENILGSSVASLIDRSNRLDITVLHSGMSLTDADNTALFAGKNLALVGDEIIQFAKAEPLGSSRFRLSKLFRGLGNTERFMGSHLENEQFLLIESATLRRLDPAAIAIGTSPQMLAIGIGDATPAAASLLLAGNALQPWSPVHQRINYQDNGDIGISWTRRSRAGSRWNDNIDLPLAEEIEHYRLLLSHPSVQNISAEATVPFFTLSAQLRSQLSNQGAGSLDVQVRQVGRHALSEPLRFTVIL